jgi:hypothetical protein
VAAFKLYYMWQLYSPLALALFICPSSLPLLWKDGIFASWDIISGVGTVISLAGKRGRSETTKESLR